MQRGLSIVSRSVRMASSSSSGPRLAKRLDAFGAETVWQEFTPLARECNAINLGQGFPDWATPALVKDALKRSQDEDQNQYCRSAGHQPLVQALAKRYSTLFGRPVDWESEVTVGVGATETLFATMHALLDEGDEAVLISPSFDIYASQVVLAGGVCRFVPLRVASDAAQPGKQEWRLDMAELRAAFTPRTRVLLLNSPHNPTGKILSPEELRDIAAVLADFPAVVVVSDEVYEHMVYDGRECARIATVPGMAERTVTVSSSGKTFSCTGWKIGWAVGPPALIRGIVLMNQWVQFSVSTPCQAAIATALVAADAPYEGHATYYAWLLSEYVRKRDILLAGLRAAGLTPIAPEGGFFIVADTSNIAVPPAYMAETTKAAPVMRRDWAFSRWLVKELRVGSIPPSAFYEGEDKDLARNLVRFAFCKEDASIHEACKRLLALREHAIDKSKLPPL